MKKLLLFGIMLCTFTTCSKQNQDVKVLLPPAPSFVVHNDNCKAPCSLLFFNTTKGTYDTEYLWIFGDGDSSRLDSPQHTFYDGGKYMVQLIAKNKLGFFPTQPDNATKPSNLLSEFTLKSSDGLEIIVYLTWQ